MELNKVDKSAYLAKPLDPEVSFCPHNSSQASWQVALQNSVE
jgi:hypothetical protein